MKYVELTYFIGLSKKVLVSLFIKTGKGMAEIEELTFIDIESGNYAIYDIIYPLFCSPFIEELKFSSREILSFTLIENEDLLSID